MPYPHWDPVKGWGQPFIPPDKWTSPSGFSGTNWTWHGSFTDQGLLYHWPKYEKKSVTIINGWNIENWGYDPETGKVQLQQTFKNELSKFSCDHKYGEKNWPPPLRDNSHLTGTYRRKRRRRGRGKGFNFYFKNPTPLRPQKNMYGSLFEFLNRLPAASLFFPNSNNICFSLLRIRSIQGIFTKS